MESRFLSLFTLLLVHHSSNTNGYIEAQKKGTCQSWLHFLILVGVTYVILKLLYCPLEMQKCLVAKVKSEKKNLRRTFSKPLL